MPDVDRNTPSRLLDYLPEIYRDREHLFLSRYLSAFENILIGRDDDVEIPAGTEPASSRSLEETIAGLATLFDPAITPKDFLPWLASWAALSLRADLNEGQQRSFVANIIQLYRRRGTKGNLIELLKLFTGTSPKIDENATPSATFQEQYEYSSTDHFFEVTVLLGDTDWLTVERQRAIARALIDLEKPAYTFYELVVIPSSSIRIGNYSDINNPEFHANLGDNTLINIWLDSMKPKT